MDLFNLGAKITLDTGDYESKIEVAKKAFEGLKTTVSGINKVGEATAEVVGTVSGAIASGVGAMAKQAIDAYANYEQLIGGVDTLFKEASSVVQRYAENAYKTAGMSANTYMEKWRYTRLPPEEHTQDISSKDKLSVLILVNY